jgi:hypothetical protein
VIKPASVVVHSCNPSYRGWGEGCKKEEDHKFEANLDKEDFISKTK